MSRLNKKKQAVWDKLNYVPKPKGHIVDLDINSMYMTMNLPVLSITPVKIKEGDCVTFRLVKNR